MIARSIFVLVALAGAACSSTPSPEEGQLRVTPLVGEVAIVDGGERSLLDEPATFDAGVSVVTQPGARARIDMPGERTMELAPETELRVEENLSEVAKGGVLVETSSPVQLRAGGSEMEADEGTFRVERDVSSAAVLLGIYSGEISVLGSGVPPIPALRQASVLAGGEIPSGVEPLQIRPNDPWDSQILGSAIDLGLRLLTYEEGLTRQLPSDREADAVSRLLQRDFSPQAIRTAIEELGNAASAVVAAVVAQEAARIDGGSSKRILGQIISLQSFGWIFVVAEWGLSAAAEALTERLRELADSISDIVAPPPAPALNTSVPGTASGGNAGGQGSTTTTIITDPPGNDTGGGGGGGGSGQPGATTQPPDPPPAEDNPQESSQPPPPPPPSQGGCSNAVDCTVTDILDDPPRSNLPI